ncbi:MAG: hypothetical protein P0Y53_23960 [Candidatus Pseudobacter hemicellulosilyticus]|uniref:DUF8201 domain-containing protein n=1 Tax=Candidatus Pseudobacter hemicellulosilyticus TaxID=3121375 RepID=A0AAJ5WTU0_9BACT|nr:MAG: hypothetical protein P0Y53_23960 [Pseudobacter sp.]
MLYLALHYCLCSVLCVVAGVLFHALMPAPAPQEAPPAARPAFVYFLTGLVLLTGIGQWIILLFPLQWTAQALLLVLLTLLCFLYRKRLAPPLAELFHRARQASPWLVGSLAVLLLLVLCLNAGPSLMDDTDSYHGQMVQWIREYGTVPGLANLHLRYGFNSSWFTSIALFSSPLPGINSNMALNGLLSCWLGQYLLSLILTPDSSLPQAGRRNLGIGLLLLYALALITWPMIRGNAVSANYDFIACSCILVLFISQLSAGRFSWQPEWLLWGAYLFTVRFIHFPWLLPGLLSCGVLLAAGRWKYAGTYLLLAAGLLLPFLIRNVQLSGYPLFPVYQLDLFRPDWKADPVMTQNIVDYIHYYNRVNVQFKPVEETMALSFPGWIPHWFRHIFSYDKPLLLLGLAGLLASCCCLPAIRKRYHAGIQWLLLTAGIQVLCWFFFFPDPRFVYGPLLCFALMGCLLLPAPALPARSTRILTILLTAGLLLYSGNKLRQLPDGRQLALPAPLPVPPLDTLKLDGITLYIPEAMPGNWNARCYGTPLPCLYRVHPRLRARGQSLHDGFYLAPADNTRPEERNVYNWY